MKIECEERYREAQEYAEKINDQTLQDCFDRLKNWEKNDDEIILYRDIYPLSFYFKLMRNGKRIMDGGVVYHEYSNGWEIHT